MTLKPEFISYVAERYDIPLRKPKDVKRALKVLDFMATDRKTYDFTDMILFGSSHKTMFLLTKYRI